MKRLWKRRMGRLLVTAYLPLTALFAAGLVALQYAYDRATIGVAGEEARVRQTLTRSAQLVSGLYAAYAACRESRPFDVDSLRLKGVALADALPEEPSWAAAHTQEWNGAVYWLKTLQERREPGSAREAAFAECHKAIRAFESRIEPGVRLLRRRLADLHQEKERWRTRHFILTAGMILLVGVTFLGLGLAVEAFLLRPLLYLEKATEGLASGDALNFDLPDSIAEFNRVREHLGAVAANHKEVVEFAALAAENRETALAAYNFAQTNVVSSALAQVRRQILRTAELERARQRAAEGMQAIDEALRRHGKDFQEACDAFIIALVKYVKCNSGAIFLLDDSTPSDPFLTLVSSYAYDKKVTSFDKRLRIGEGVVGQAALELQPIHLKQVPDSYVIFIPGVGEITPSSVLVLPMVAGNALQGVIELASFSRFRDDELDFIRRASEKAATTLDNIRHQKRAAAAVERAEILEDELKRRTAELERQNRELTRTREELKALNETLEARIAEIGRVNEALSASERRFLTLLENAAEIITIFEANGSVRFHSPNTERIVGYSANELNHFFRFVHQDDSAKVRTFFQQSLTTPGSTLSVQYKYYR
ncbi:MAG: GAF domain-containing protein, partial [Bacteroidia bacterium]|nr:GAF domain-containing protein [Bacteroidia bacterium]